jgi:hypothetical protein
MRANNASSEATLRAAFINEQHGPAIFIFITPLFRKNMQKIPIDCRDMVDFDSLWIIV